jgi:hypothetical protein
VVVDKPLTFDAKEEPYKVAIKPRSQAHQNLIERECPQAAAIREHERY